MRRACAMALLAALLLAGGCGSVEPTARRLLLVGIDGAEWSVIEPLLEDGRMPTLERLIDTGASCGLRSLEPKQKSPTVWTSIATGKLPAKHGVGGYLHPASGKLITSNVREARTVWDILGQEGHTVTVVGWLVTWPAEAVSGYLVTDYFRRSNAADDEPVDRLTYPEELREEIAPLLVSPEDVPVATVARFAAPAAAPSSADVELLTVPEKLLEKSGADAIEDMMHALRDLIAGDQTFLAVSRHLMRHRATDATFVYLRGVDSASHRFWAAGHRGEVGFPVSRTEEAVFGHVVERYYEHADEMLGALIEDFGEGGTIIVCSDHGFEGPRPGRLPGGIRDHGPVGILVMAGDDVREGGRIEERSVCDLAPTILALFGLPVGDDMDGSVIESALTESFLQRSPTRVGESYEAFP